MFPVIKPSPFLGRCKAALFHSQKDLDSVIERIRKCCSTFSEIEELGPDYQRCFWNQSTKTIWWESSDGDESKSVKEVIKRLEKIKGVREVKCEAECSPPKGEGWQLIFPVKDSRDWFNKKDLSWLDNSRGGVLVPPPAVGKTKREVNKFLNKYIKGLEQQGPEEAEFIPDEDIQELDNQEQVSNIQPTIPQIKPSPFLRNTPPVTQQEQVEDVLPEEQEEDTEEDQVEVPEQFSEELPQEQTQEINPNNNQEQEEQDQEVKQEPTRLSGSPSNQENQTKENQKEVVTNKTKLTEFASTYANGLREGLSQQTHLSKEQQEAYGNAMEVVLSHFSDNAIQMAFSNVSEIAWHGDKQSVTDQWNNTLREGEEPIPKGQRLAGFYDPYTNRLDIDGEDNDPLLGKRREENKGVIYGTYGHELAHAIDKQEQSNEMGRFSNTPEWLNIWRNEICQNFPSGLAKLSKYAQSTPEEGFAEMMRGFVEANHGLLESILPQAFHFFVKNQLVNTVSKKMNKR